MEEYGKDVLSGDVSLEVGVLPDFRCPYGEVHIHLAEDYKPKTQKPFHLTGEREEVMKAMVDDLINQHFIEEYHSGLWANNAFPVLKPGSKSNIPWRRVGHYRHLSKQTVLDEHPLPLTENMIQDQGLNWIFTIIDLKQGFHQMPPAPESQPRTAFWLRRKQYLWRVMPMGIKNAGAFFQQMTDEMLGDLKTIHCYIDDILVGFRAGSDNEMLTKHNNDVRRVLEQLRKFKIIPETSKVDLFTHSVQFCGHILKGGTRKPAPGNESQWKGGRSPATSEAYEDSWEYAIPIPTISRTTPRLQADSWIALKEYPTMRPTDLEDGSPEADKQFGELKKALLIAVPLQIIDYSKSSHIDTDASKYAFGAELQQVGEDGKQRPPAPGAYPAPAGYETAAVQMDVCGPAGYSAPAGYRKPPLRWTSARPTAKPGRRKTTHTTHSTTHRASTPEDRSQEDEDTAHATQHIERAHW